MSGEKTQDTIDSVGDNGKKYDLAELDGDNNLPTYRVPTDAVETAKPKKSYITRIAHSFRRRDETVRLNSLGQMVVDPEKDPSVTSDVGNDTSRLERKLKGRHMQMIAIGGAIGTGLFIGSGSALATGGPLALLLGFGIVGIMLFCVIHALGELAVVFPIAGIFFI